MSTRSESPSSTEKDPICLRRDRMKKKQKEVPEIITIDSGEEDASEEEVQFVPDDDAPVLEKVVKHKLSTTPIKLVEEDGNLVEILSDEDEKRGVEGKLPPSRETISQIEFDNLLSPSVSDNSTEDGEANTAQKGGNLEDILDENLKQQPGDTPHSFKSPTETGLTEILDKDIKTPSKSRLFSETITSPLQKSDSDGEVGRCLEDKEIQNGNNKTVETPLTDLNSHIENKEELSMETKLEAIKKQILENTAPTVSIMLSRVDFMKTQLKCRKELSLDPSLKNINSSSPSISPGRLNDALDGLSTDSDLDYSANPTESELEESDKESDSSEVVVIEEIGFTQPSSDKGIKPSIFNSLESEQGPMQERKLSLDYTTPSRRLRPRTSKFAQYSEIKDFDSSSLCSKERSSSQNSLSDADKQSFTKKEISSSAEEKSFSKKGFQRVHHSSHLVKPGLKSGHKKTNLGTSNFSSSAIKNEKVISQFQTDDIKDTISTYTPSAPESKPVKKLTIKANDLKGVVASTKKRSRGRPSLKQTEKKSFNATEKGSSEDIVRQKNEKQYESSDTQSDSIKPTKVSGVVSKDKNLGKKYLTRNKQITLDRLMDKFGILVKTKDKNQTVNELNSTSDKGEGGMANAKSPVDGYDTATDGQSSDFSFSKELALRTLNIDIDMQTPPDDSVQLVSPYSMMPNVSTSTPKRRKKHGRQRLSLPRARARKESFICDICQFEVETMSKFEKHIEEHTRDDEKLQEVRVTQVTDVTNVPVKASASKGRKVWSCSFEGCNQKFKVPQDLGKHEFWHAYEIHKSVIYECPYGCGFENGDLFEFINHKRTKHEKLPRYYRCNVFQCDFYCFSAVDMEAHTQTLDDEYHFPCLQDGCEEVFSDLVELVKHEQREKHEFEVEEYRRRLMKYSIDFLKALVSD